MEPPALTSLLPLASRRFQSFAEAAETCLAMLGGVLSGAVVIGQIERDERLMRVLDARGAEGLGIERGTTLPVSGAAAAAEADAGQLAAYRGDDLDRQLLGSLGIVERATLPIELSDGSVVGLVCALSQRPGAYQSDHLILLGLASRLLSYEWERVSAGAELRQLRQKLNEGAHIDAETGLSDREGVIEKVAREWRLARRGTVESMVVVCRINVEAHDSERNSALTMLALKDAAEVLSAVARWTDHVGRIGPCDLCVVMVGADGLPGVEAMSNRYAEALRRVTGGRPYEISIEFGAQALSEASTPEQGIELAEQAVGDLRVAGIGAGAAVADAEPA
jgi:GGDEF domain-containing protein